MLSQSRLYKYLKYSLFAHLGLLAREKCDLALLSVPASGSFGLYFLPCLIVYPGDQVLFDIGRHAFDKLKKVFPLLHLFT